MPLATVETDMVSPDGKKDFLWEFLCDTSGCGNIATQVVGTSAELRLSLVTCEDCERKTREAKEVPGKAA